MVTYSTLLSLHCGDHTEDTSPRASRLLQEILEHVSSISLESHDYHVTRCRCDFLVIAVSLIAVFLELNPLYHSLAVIRPIKLIR